MLFQQSYIINSFLNTVCRNIIVFSSAYISLETFDKLCVSQGEWGTVAFKMVVCNTFASTCKGQWCSYAANVGKMSILRKCFAAQVQDKRACHANNARVDAESRRC